MDPVSESLQSPASEGDEFENRVQNLVSKIEDPAQFRRMIAEMYIFLSDMDTGMRGFMSGGGPGAMLSRLMGGKGNK